MSPQLGDMRLTRMSSRHVAENGRSENAAGGGSVFSICRAVGPRRKAVIRAVSQIRRAIGAFQKQKQEDYAIPDGAVLEADEAAMKTWKTQTPRGRVRWAADIWIGVVGRGSRKTSLYHIGTRYSKVKKRFPNIKNYIWGRIWKRFLMKRIRNVATITICTDSKPMYRPKKLRLGYEHYDVVHQKNNFGKSAKPRGSK